MGNRQSTKEKRQDKHPLNKDTKEAAAKKETDQSSFAKLPTSPDDLNHSKSKDLTGNLNNTATTSQGLGPTKLISHSVEPSNGKAVDVPQNREQSILTTVNTSQDADLVKSIPYLARVTQQHICPAKPEDRKTNIPKARLQQATPARPAVGPRHGVKTSAGDFDALRSDILQQLKDAPQTLSQQQSPSTAPVQQMTKPVWQRKKTAALLQQQTYRQVTYGNTLYEESKRTVAARDMGTRATADSVRHSDVSASVQVPAQVLRKYASPQVECSEVVRDATTENLLSKEAEAKMKAKINKSPSHATDKAHGIAEQSTSTKPGVAEVPASTPTEPPNHSTQMSNQPKTEVNNEENALQEPGLNHDNVTNMISVEYCYFFSAKSETSRANTAKIRLRQKLAKKLKAQPQDGSKSSQQTVEESVTATVQESSQQQCCTAMEAKKHKDPRQIPQPNKADCDTNGNPSSCIQKVNVKAPEAQVPVVEQRPAAAPNITATHHPTTATAAADVKSRLQGQLKVSLPQDTAVKPKKKCTFIALNQTQPKGNAGNVAVEEKLNGNNGQVVKEKPEPAISPALRAESRWHPFTVNQSCSCRARCHHNPGTGLPPNVQKWFDECPNHLCEPPWVTTAKLAACLALREAQEEGGDSHQ